MNQVVHLANVECTDAALVVFGRYPFVFSPFVAGRKGYTRLLTQVVEVAIQTEKLAAHLYFNQFWVNGFVDSHFRGKSKPNSSEIFLQHL